MPNVFTRMPEQKNMVTESCIDMKCLGLLCARCGWEGHCEPSQALSVFMTHSCKLRSERHGRD